MVSIDATLKSSLRNGLHASRNLRERLQVPLYNTTIYIFANRVKLGGMSASLIQQQGEIQISKKSVSFQCPPPCNGDDVWYSSSPQCLLGIDEIPSRLSKSLARSVVMRSTLAANENSSNLCLWTLFVQHCECLKRLASFLQLSSKKYVRKIDWFLRKRPGTFPVCLSSFLFTTSF